MTAIGLLVYADAAEWFAARNHSSVISGYVEQVNATPSEERRAILDAAYAYNDQLEPGPLTDPYITQDEDERLRSDVYESYEELLRVSGTDAIGTVNYPQVDIALPIHHGTSEESISSGAGHMYGTSLPVGGPSTRAVLTAHSGLPQAELFTPLLDATVGDTFWISVLGEDHHYEVRAVETVLPGETDSLEIIESEDWVTLFTCAPIGINSHRFMVHAVRIPSPADSDQHVVEASNPEAGFPWWAVIFIGASSVVALAVFPPRRRRREATRQGTSVGPR